MIDRTSEQATIAREVAQAPSWRARTWTGLWRFTRTKPLGAIGGILVPVLVIVALPAPVLAPYGARDFPDSRQGRSTVYIPPNSQFWMGTDHVGRDVLSRLVHGARISLYVGLGSVIVGISASFILGVSLAYAGGKIDLVAQSFVDALMALPGLIIALAIVAVLGSSLNNVILAIVIGMIAPVIRTVRSQVLSLKELDYVIAAGTIGASATRVVLRHFVPNSFAIYWCLPLTTWGLRSSSKRRCLSWASVRPRSSPAGAECSPAPHRNT